MCVPLPVAAFSTIPMLRVRRTPTPLKNLKNVIVPSRVAILAHLTYCMVAHLYELDCDRRLANTTAAYDDHFIGLRLSARHVDRIRCSGSSALRQAHATFGRCKCERARFRTGWNSHSLDLSHADFIKQMQGMRLIAILASPTNFNRRSSEQAALLCFRLVLQGRGWRRGKRIIASPTLLPAASHLGCGADGAATSWLDDFIT